LRVIEGMEKRKYTKRDKDYWNSLSGKLSSGRSETPQKHPLSHLASASTDEFFSEIDLVGSPYYSQGSYSRRGLGGSTSSTRGVHAPFEDKLERFGNIARYGTPYAYAANDVSARDAVILCQKAYANIAIFRNTIDLMSEFANSPMFLDGGSAKSRDLINKWLKRIKIWKVKDQFFREYYRSGNVFFYRINADFNTAELRKIKSSYSEAAVGTMVSRYILLNPADIAYSSSLNHETNNYKKILSQFELMQLKSPKTERDKALYKSLSPEEKQRIQTSSYLSDGLYIDLDPELIAPIFYKKQDYEPFAIPFGYPVLDDINWKLELKKRDQAISRTVENVILLITMGDEPEKGGVNGAHLKAIQGLFSSEKAGRVLVSDYTTKAEFVIPEISAILGPEKYEVVNQDIQQGLQNIMFEDSKYSNSSTKAKIFMKRLGDARGEFLQFIQQEIDDTCDRFGIRDYPSAKFLSTDMSDEASLQKVTTRLIELGVLHPEDGVEAIKTHTFPSKEKMEESQKRLAEERQKGWYNPLVGGVPVMEGSESNTPTRIPPKENGRPSNASYSAENVVSAAREISKLKVRAESKAKTAYGKKRLTKDMKDVLGRMCDSIVQSSEISEWDAKMDAVFAKKINLDDLDPIDEIKALSYEMDIDYLQASMMYHSKKLIEKAKQS
jgi:hypothetical protein